MPTGAAISSLSFSFNIRLACQDGWSSFTGVVMDDPCFSFAPVRSEGTEAAIYRVVSETALPVGFDLLSFEDIGAEVHRLGPYLVVFCLRR